MKSNTNVSIFGGGSWGTSLANLIAHNSRQVKIWAKETSVCDSINKLKENKLFLPGHKLSDNLEAVYDIKNKDFLKSNIYIFTIPTQYIRPILLKLKNHINPKSIIINASKGIDIKSLKFINQIFSESANIESKKYVTLSGPSFAEDVANELPTAVTLSSKSSMSLELSAALFENTNLKVYRSNDVIGVEIGGALKNVIAIGAGIIDLSLIHI